MHRKAIIRLSEYQNSKNYSNNILYLYQFLCLFTFFIINSYLNQQKMSAGLLGALNIGGLNMELISQAVQGILKFNTQKQAFNRTYPQVDHLQRYFNEKAVNHFVEVITNKYHQNPKPLAIVDIACGYGLPTVTIRKRLEQNKVEVSKIVGYDVSGDMIHFAQVRNDFDNVQFVKKNIQTEFDDVQQYDVAICLFGLHWMNKLDSTIDAIHRSLKPGGIFLSLTPIEIKDLFDFRTNFVNHSKWSSAFDAPSKQLHPFHFNKEDYLTPLSKYFTTIREQKKETKFNYTRLEYITFLQSWLQEVRHLTNEVGNQLKKDAIAKAYIGDFLDSIDKNLQGNVIIHEDGSVVYTQHTFEFDGQKA